MDSCSTGGEDGKPLSAVLETDVRPSLHEYRMCGVEDKGGDMLIRFLNLVLM